MNISKVILAVLLLAIGDFSHAAKLSVNLEVGRQWRAPSDRTIKRAAIGNDEIADVQVDGNLLLVMGKKPGKTDLMVWYGDDTEKPSLQVELLVVASAGLKQRTVSRLDSADLQVREAGDKLGLSGQSRSLESHAQVRQALDAKSDASIDASVLDFDTQVQIDIKIVEVSRRRLQNAGLFLGKNTANTTLALSTPGNMSGVQSAGEGALSLLSSGFFPHAQAFNFLYGNATEGILGVVSVLENNGFAYTLAEPTLVAMSGQSANFLAGGEFPIPIRAGGTLDSGITVRFKEFGVRVALTPTVLDDNRIALKVAPEVSELDFTAGIQSGGVAVPALRVRRTDTSLSLGDGESFVISGLVSQNTIGSVDKFPWLGDIPILGAFFRSTSIDRTDKELIMVVTPHLVRPIAKGAPLPPMPGERFRKYDPNFFEVFFKETGEFKAKTPVRSGFSD
ncbi:type II and III secretion system protein family protein [Methylotuvimicrobium sp. KM2]|uniref:type II and III secretion system protein family protein n=1 Tax=Methylotuvimicrobium sp. KM2 TaxID=3133976 RepID=UPI003100F894